jgi:CcmD family protein
MPDTYSYFLAGYIVIFVLLLGYVLHLFLLRKKIKRQRDELSAEDS